MKKIIFLTLLLTVSSFAIAKNKKITFPNGDRYEGEVKKGIPYGFGTMLYVNGNKYVGNWIDGKRSGTGKYTSIDSIRGTIQTDGVWHNDQLLKGQISWGGIVMSYELNNEGKTFYGSFKSPNGEGEVEGEWKPVDFYLSTTTVPSLINGTMRNFPVMGITFSGIVKNERYMSGSVKGEIFDNSVREYYDGNFDNFVYTGKYRQYDDKGDGIDLDITNSHEGHGILKKQGIFIYKGDFKLNMDNLVIKDIFFDGAGTIVYIATDYIANVRGVWKKGVASWAEMALTVGEKSGFAIFKESDNIDIYDTPKHIANGDYVSVVKTWDNQPITDKRSKVIGSNLSAFVESTKKESISFFDAISNNNQIEPNRRYLLSFDVDEIRESDIEGIKYMLIGKINTPKECFIIQIYSNNRRYMTLAYPSKIWMECAVRAASVVENPFPDIFDTDTYVITIEEFDYLHSEEINIIGKKSLNKREGKDNNAEERSFIPP